MHEFHISKVLDVKDLFITTIVHSTDHYFVGKLTDTHYLSNNVLPNKSYFNHILVYWPVQYLVMPNKLENHKHGKNPFYVKLYSKLAKVDSLLADNVALYISWTQR